MGHRWSFSEVQAAELLHLAEHASKPYVRVRAIALVHLASGKTCQEAGEAVLAHRTVVGSWAKRYMELGAAGLEVSIGRGRKSTALKEEIENYLRRAPREFGVPRARWTLQGLVDTVPSLKGMTPSGGYRVLKRLGFGYKRGQPRLHSPDPDYEAKRGRS